MKRLKFVLVSPTCRDSRLDLIQSETLDNSLFIIDIKVDKDGWLLKRFVSSANWMVTSWFVIL